MTPADLDEAYASIGHVVWHLQFLEDVLVTYVTMRLKLTRPVLWHVDRERGHVNIRDVPALADAIERVDEAVPRGLEIVEKCIVGRAFLIHTGVPT